MTGVESVSVARISEQEEIKNLLEEQNELINQIVGLDGTLKTKIIQIAKIMERRQELNDLHFGISEISTEITRILRDKGCSVANCVRQYLPKKFKNANLIRNEKPLDYMIDLVDGGVELRQPLEDFSISDLESLLVYLKMVKNDGNDKLGGWINNQIDDVRREALRRGVELDKEKYRAPISEKAFRFKIPDYFGLEELNKEVQNQGNRLIMALWKFFNVKYPQCPATQRQDAYKYANSIRVSANLMEEINEGKNSGDKVFWWDREFWNHCQSTHQAGNSTFFPTTLCAYCSSNIKEDPNDYHLMKYWPKSPTGFLCDRCGGTEMLMRFNSRENVGDKFEQVLRDAQDFAMHIKDYAEVYYDWMERYKNMSTDARKIAISGEFSKAAFGKEKIVVHDKTKPGKN